MSVIDTRKHYAGIALCIFGLIGSGVGLFLGILVYLFEREPGFLALLIISVFGFIGTIIGIVVIALRIRKLRGIQRSQDARLWLILSIVFLILATTSHLWLRYFGIIVMAVIISIFSALFFMSIIFVIINRDQFRKNE
jgi:hypothetical protein